MQKIVIAHFANIVSYPPVISLIENLLEKKFTIDVVSIGTEALPANILKCKKVNCHELELRNDDNLISKIVNRWYLNNIGKKIVITSMKNADVLWTTTALTVRYLDDVVLNYKHVMQLMELQQYCPRYKSFSLFKFPLEKYAKHAWKVVVPEENRAYIQKVWWDLENVPSVLPNKPYSIENMIDTSKYKNVIDLVRNEPRKIILYSGGLGEDRNIDEFINSMKYFSSEYCLYIMASLKYSKYTKENLESNPGVRYLGYFNAPTHLYFFKYAYVGLLPYNPKKIKVTNLSELNALYCAPNKLYEYSGNGVPMIGSDVLGLKIPFEKYNIGVCCKNFDKDSLSRCLEYIANNYEILRSSCYDFYNDTDLDKIVYDILN